MKRALPWPADKIERWPLDRIIPDAHNPRTHSDEQIAQIAASIREWGWTNPLLVDEDSRLIAGHGRLLAASQLGFTEAPVMVARGWTDAQKRAYLIADNKLALNAGWDEELLAAELGGLMGIDFDIALTGFGGDELSALIGSAPDEPDPNRGDGGTGGTAYREQYGVIVICDDATAQEQTYDCLSAMGYTCKVVCT